MKSVKMNDFILKFVQKSKFIKPLSRLFEKIVDFA